jgi:hypothetical protein
MDLQTLRTSVEMVRRNTPALFSRAATYLRTYPALLSIARQSEADDRTKFLQLATVAYGWMPRIVRLDPVHLDSAIEAFTRAQAATEVSWNQVSIEHVAACLHSVVGASKLLHFANPEVFPIWDRNVERISCGTEPSQYHMDQLTNYVSYAGQVHELRQAAAFHAFFDEFTHAYKERLDRLEITRYPLTQIRAVEAAAFELAGDEDDA